MASQTPLRRSGRARLPAKKFQGDLHDAEAANGASGGEDEDATEHTDVPLLSETILGPDSLARSAAEASGQPRDADADADYAVPSASDSERDEELEPEPENTPTKSGAWQAPGSKAVKRTAAGKAKTQQAGPQSQSKNRPSTRNRGLLNPPKWNRREDIISDIAGSNEPDIARLMVTIKRWVVNPVAPSRASLKAAAQDNIAARSSDTNSWDWFHMEGGSETMWQAQAARPIEPGEVEYYYPPRADKQKVVLGPPLQQTLFTMRLDTPMHLTEPWTPVETTGAPPHSQPGRNGWVMNLGAKVHSVAWIPNITGNLQYLSVSLTKDGTSAVPSHSAFEPAPPYAACIQIWAFHSTQEHQFDQINRPFLAHVLCANWGMCVKMEWHPDYEPDGIKHSTMTHLGLLASVWCDGYARVLDVWLPEAHEEATTHVLYSDTAFAVKPPDSICTSISWASDKDLIVGCANGQVAVWNVAQSVYPKIAGEIMKTPNPFLVESIHHGYVLDVVSCSPELPHLVVSSGTDGNLRLTDLRDPEFDSTYASRSRIFPHCIAYCGSLGMVLSQDGLEGLSALHVRRFFSRITIRNCEAQIAAIACSDFHPFCLVGMADGSVVLQNLVTRLFDTRRTAESYEIRWFQHEWMPQEGVGSVAWYERHANKDPPIKEVALDNEESMQTFRPGISRILEAFTTRSRRDNLAASKAQSKKAGESRKSETIHEEPTAITSIAWHTNAEYGGWAAAGMGSGLLRVEDLAV